LWINGQIKDELDVFAKEATLTKAKQINKLASCFWRSELGSFICSLLKMFLLVFFDLSLSQVHHDPVRAISIGQKVEDLLANPENKEWLLVSAELYGG